MAKYIQKHTLGFFPQLFKGGQLFDLFFRRLTPDLGSEGSIFHALTAFQGLLQILPLKQGHP